MPPTLQQINEKTAEVEAVLQDVRQDLSPIPIISGTPTLKSTPLSSTKVKNLQAILDAGTQAQDEIIGDIQRRADDLTRMTAMENELRGIFNDAKDKWEQAQSLVDSST